MNDMETLIPATHLGAKDIMPPLSVMPRGVVTGTTPATTETTAT